MASSFASCCRAPITIPPCAERPALQPPATALPERLTYAVRQKPSARSVNPEVQRLREKQRRRQMDEEAKELIDEEVAEEEAEGSEEEEEEEAEYEEVEMEYDEE